MNAKKAKKLRSLANQSTLGMPMVDYSTNHQPAQYTVFQGIPIKTAKGVPQKLVTTCTRKVYKDLKREHKAA